MPFTKGDPNCNRNGRPPKEQALTHLLREYLDEEEDGIIRKQRLCSMLYHMARDGDVAAIKYIFDRIDGKIPENINANINSFSEWVKSISDDAESGKTD